jgi:hypothetical protein
MKTRFGKTFIYCSVMTLLNGAPLCATEPGAKDGGGGNFSIPMIWNQIEVSIAPSLKRLKATGSEQLSPEDIDALLALMSEKVTTIVETNETLTVVLNGKEEPVDAKNFPDNKLIKLFKPTWTHMVHNGFSIAYLILHEFMGLARIPDRDSKVSRKIFPPEKEPLDFDSTQVVCEANIKYVKFNSQRWYVRDPESHRITIPLSKEHFKSGSPKCVINSSDGKECLRYAGDYRVKTGRGTLQLAFDEDTGASRNYSVTFKIHLISDYFGFGWGAAADVLDIRNPHLSVVFDVTSSGESLAGKTLSQVSMETSERTRWGKLSLGVVESQFPLSIFNEVIESNDYMLGIHPFDGELTHMYHSYNIAGFLEEVIKDAGFQATKEDLANRNKYVAENVFRGYEIMRDRNYEYEGLPFRIYAGCRLLDPVY